MVDEPTIDLNVTYNNGLTYITDTFKGQKAGTVKGIVQAATGYKITGVNKAYYSIGGYPVNLDNFTATKVSDDKYSYSFDLSNDDIKELKDNPTITLSVDAENPNDDYGDDGEEIPPITIDTTKLVNCTVSPATIEAYEDTELTITANPGYVLTGTGSYTVDGTTKTFTANNVTSYKITVNAEAAVSISFTATKPLPAEPSIDLQVTYNNGVENVVDIFKGQKAGTVKGTIQAAPGYEITNVQYAYYIVVAKLTSLANFTATKISDYKYSYSFDLTEDDINNLNSFKELNTQIVIYVDTRKLPGNINVDVSKLVNCSISPATITQGQETVLTLNADNGYILNGTGSYTVDGITTSFTCNNTYSYKITVTANAYVYVFFTATKSEENKINSIVHTYVLSQDDYNNIGKQVIAGINSNGTGFDQYDYTNFVNYLYQIPFKVDDDITTSTSTINLGKQNINIDCQKVTHETLNIDLGSIDLTGVSSSHDYNPINTTLYCPFSNNIVLPPTVIGSKLYLSFSINLKTEQALLLVKQNNSIIYSGQTEMFTDLPLYFTAGRQDTLVKKLKAQYQNTIKQAYVVINYHKPITDLSSYKTTEHGTLSNYKGFTRVSHGTLKQSINNTIDNSILNLLRQGVIIK